MFVDKEVATYTGPVDLHLTNVVVYEVPTLGGRRFRRQNLLPRPLPPQLLVHIRGFEVMRLKKVAVEAAVVVVVQLNDSLNGGGDDGERPTPRLKVLEANYLLVLLK